MKIVMVTEYLAPKGKPVFGGADARAINIAKCLSKNHDVHVITSLLQGTEKIEPYDGVIVHRVGDMRKFIQRGEFIQRLRFNNAVASEIQRLRPDIVDASGFVSYSGAYKGAKKLGVPIVVTVFEVWQGEWIRNMGLLNGAIGSVLERVYLKRSFNRYIAISDFTKEKLINKFRIPDEKISVVYCGIDLKLYNSIFIEATYENPTIITICRLVEYKRVQDLIQAVNILKKDIPNINLKIVGIGPYEQKLKKLTKNLNLNSNVEFLGKISQTEELIKIMKKSHISALPSIVEGFGMVIVEAMAAGIPYVASDIAPIREVTKGGIGGILSKPLDPQELALNLKRLLSNESLRDILSKQGKEHVKSFDWNNISKQIELIYRGLK